VIISCINCKKNFDINSSLIPEKGRLLQCNGCSHKWFFKKITKDEPTSIIKVNEHNEEPEIFKDELEPILNEAESPKTIELLDRVNDDVSGIEKILINDDKSKKNDNIDLEINFSESKKNYNILGLTLVSIISAVALILVLDTFQGPISKIFPNIEFLLYNFYETINDIKLFIRDLN
jgi:predicted Zn finger-like uncharacterized protein